MIPLSIVIGAITLGFLYALMAMGYSLINGIIHITNLAHGHIIIIGSYLLYLFIIQVGLNPIAAVLGTVSVAFVLGMIFDTALFKSVRASPEAILLVSVGLAVLIDQMMLIIWGPNQLTVPRFINFPIEIGGVSVDSQRLSSVIVVLVILSILWLFLKKSKQGTALRMVGDNRELAMLSGINVEKIFKLTAGLATALAACGGCLLAPLFGMIPETGWTYLIKSFAVVLLGGTGSLFGSMIGGLVLGSTETLFGFYISSAYEDVVFFVTILVVLSVRPSGLFGRRTERI